MGMVVRTNTMAQNAYRQLGVNNTAVGKSLEKLSSGFRINRAADDASGLAISEKMKAQIKGLEQASANSQDGISLIQTAEGATTEIHNMLNRMTELATKSANGTIQDPVDREAIQQEVNDLNAEISRIAQSTNFNGINLLDGSLGGVSGKVSPLLTATKADGTISAITKGAATAAKTGKLTIAAAGNATNAAGDVEVKFKDETGKDITVKVNLATSDLGAAKTKEDIAKTVIDKLNADATFRKYFKAKAEGNDGFSFESITSGAKSPSLTSVEIKATSNGTALLAADSTFTAGVKTPANAYSSFSNGAALAAGDTFTINGKTFEMIGTAGDPTKTKGATAIVIGGGDSSVANINAALKDMGLKVDYTGATTTYSFSADPTATAKGLKLQVGDTNATFNHVSVNIDDLSAEGLGLVGLDVSNQDAAGNSIQTIKDAINKVSINRANLGSLQNRLEYTINNLDTTAENMTAANSRIRDTDMAKEMMNYTKMNILTQSAQAMLAQANQQPQAILQLLQ